MVSHSDLMQHAIAAAQQCVETLGPEFANAEVAEVHEVVRSTLDLESEDIDPCETVQYDVRFVQPLDEAYIEGPGVGLTISVDGEGVSSVAGRWFTEEETNADATAAATPIDPHGPALSAVRVGDALKT